MSDLDDFLVLKPKGGLASGAAEDDEPCSIQPGLESPIRPTTVGLKLIDSPSGVSNGLVYRINGCNIERIVISEGNDDGDSSIGAANIVCSCPLSFSAGGAVHLKASPDGRMVAVACIDGSLQCFDSTSDGISLRWSIPQAHSHVSPTIDSPVSGDRSRAATASGPILGLDFSPHNYALLLADATKGVAIYDARVEEPTNLIQQHKEQELVQNVSSASWQANVSVDDNGAMPIAIGQYDGSVAILRYSPPSPSSSAIDLLQAVSECGRPSEEDGFVCTHLNWNMETIIAGFCKVIPPEDNEEPDEDDEDDNADHEACLYVTSVDEALNRCAEWSEQGDVVPFFSVPKFGRHVFFTSVLRSLTKTRLIAVATNVGSDIGTLSLEDNDSNWNPVEFQEGAGASTPTNEDDEFVFPLGICIVQLASLSSFRLLVASTDNSISTFEFQHINDPSFFTETALGSISDLPREPLKIVEPTGTGKSTNLPEGTEKNSWVVVDDTNAISMSTAEKAPAPTANSGFSSGGVGSTGSTVNAPAPSDSVATTTKEPFSFGLAGSSTFGSGSNAPTFGSGSSSVTFGSGTSSGLTFGSPSTDSTSPFSGFGKKPGETSKSSIFANSASFGGTAQSTNVATSLTTPAFGATSPLGGLPMTPKDSTNPTSGTIKPNTTFRITSGTTFGSNTQVSSGGGFAALSSVSSKNSFGFGSSSDTRTSGNTSVFTSVANPFKTFPTTQPSSSKEDIVSAEPLSETPTTKMPDNESDRKSISVESEECEKAIRDDSFSDIEKTAAKVFDKFDTTKSGKVDVTAFEELSEALGEGFYGDEYNAQVSLVDPNNDGFISRQNFIGWYKTLVEGDGDDDDCSLDTEELAEREEERVKASSAFGKLGKKSESGKSYIVPDQFGALFESMGSVYCEEEHRKTLKKVKSADGHIYEKDFLAWYIEWLFGDESDSDSDDEDSISEGNNADNEGTEDSKEVKMLGDIFKVDESEWKCNVCSIRNKASLNQCSACESPRPGFEGKVSDGGTTSIPTSNPTSSIGAGGFTFGGTEGEKDAGASSSIGAGGFSFGGTVAKPSGASSSIGAGGFSFEGTVVKPSGASPSIGAGGFSFGGTSTKGEISSIGSKGVSSGVDTSNDSEAQKEATIGIGGFSFGDNAKKGETAKVLPTNSEGLSIGLCGSKDTSPTESPKNDHQTPSDTEKTAAKVFDKFDTTKSGKVDVTAFEELSEALGEGFYGDEYNAQVSLVDPNNDGFISRQNFIGWYKTLVEGDGDDDDCSLDTEELAEREEERVKASSAFGKLGKKSESGKSYIVPDQFGALFESMGSVYCEEEHRKTLKKVKSADGHIYEKDFLAWYIEWLFGDESDSDSDDEDSISEGNNADNEGTEDSKEVKMLGDIFKVDESEWKCNVCSIRNKASLNQCSACESPRPGFEGKVSDGGTTSIPTSNPTSSIGAGGFTFGGTEGEKDAGASSSIGAGGFSFGGTVAKPSGASSSIGAGGFSFGGTVAKPVDFGASPSIGSGGFSFGGTANKNNTGAKEPSVSPFAAFSAKNSSNYSFGIKPADTAPSKTVSSAAFPPISTKAPTPFGSKPAAVPPSKTGSSAAFPPMSSKAPTPFGSKPAAATASKTTSSAAFPPMSSKAPTPFGSKPAAVPPSKTGSSAAFPPMSSKAPTPFGSKPAAATASKTTSSAAFPPMSSKAPTPFGSKPAAATASKTTSSAAFPPMSSKAPTPFGSKPAAVLSSKTGSSAAFPPMSSKAPTPFGSKPAAATASKTTSSAAFPPMSSKAPTPFGSKPAAVPPSKTGSSAAFPPMSSKAPTPFGSKPAAAAPSKTNPFTTFTSMSSPFVSKSASNTRHSNTFTAPGLKDSSTSPFATFSGTKAGITTSNNPFGTKPEGTAPSKTGSAAGFQSISNKAPTPFGSKPAVAAASKTTSSAAFPPMSSKAPTPFGSKPVAPSKTGSPAAFPPMSSQAPTPFGNKPPAAAVSKNGSTAAFPPMTSKSPTPFGSKPATAVPSKADSSAAFPPMSSKAPTPFGTKPTVKPISSNSFTLPGSNDGGKVLSSSPFEKQSNRFPQATHNPTGQIKSHGKPLTKLELQFGSVINSFSFTISEVSKMRVETFIADNELRHEIEELTIQVEQERTKLLNIDDSLAKNRSETAFLLSRKTDSSRQLDTTKGIIQEINESNVEGIQSIANSQALDRESETNRRRFAASSRNLVRRMELAKERATLLEENNADPAIGQNLLLRRVLDLYRRAKAFEMVSSRIRRDVSAVSEKNPFRGRAKRTVGRSTYSLDNSSLKSPKGYNKLRPIDIENKRKPFAAREVKPSKSSVSHWKSIESAMTQLSNENMKMDRFDTLSIEVNSEQATPDRKKEFRQHKSAPCGLLISASAKSQSNRMQEQSLSVSKRVSIFSPPSKPRARSGWDQPATIDVDRVTRFSLDAPQDLKKTTLSDSSRDTLASFGTTPERLKAAIDIKKESTSLPLSTVGSQSKDVPTKRSTIETAALPPLASTAPSNPFSNASGKKRETVASVATTKSIAQKSTSSSAALPPMPKQAPSNPFSKGPFNPSSAAKSNRPEAKSPLPPPGQKASLKEKEATSTSFGSMKVLGQSLSSESMKSDAKQAPSFGAMKSTSATETSTGKDFKTILTSFYQKYNASKIGEVDKTLQKYKGREPEMFQKLSAKYKVPNPLQESQAPLNSTSMTMTNQSTSPMGFGNSGSTMAASPFSSSSTTTQQNSNPPAAPFNNQSKNSSPFGTSTGTSAASKSNVFGTQAQSPFGAMNTQASATPFGGSQPPAQSPFGKTASSVNSSTPFGTSGGLSSASPFGSAAAPSPFGVASPSPMQPNSQRLFNGKSARELLHQFYQEKNPSKLAEVDKLLAKYSGQEEQMFRNLAKKYQLDPSVFGVSTTAPSHGMGSSAVTSGFGQTSAMGGATNSFGQSPGGFGQPSSLGGGSMSSSKPPGAGSFGSGASSGFGSSGFGSLAQSSNPSPFGGQSSGFGVPAPAFGSATPFGAPRR